ncbi:glycosyl hydrolase family 28-related protein [Chthoniobacter flavus]|nr:right-handed parallel beta-helix repeat-containing protein [Chthoniobacter flavus]
MKHHPSSLLFGCLLALCSFSLAQAQQQQSVSADGFNYTGWSTGTAPMNAVWSANTGNVPSIVTNNPSLSPSYISLANGVIDANLSRTMTTDWTASINVLNTAYSRGQWVGVFNAAGTQGYGFVWGDNQATQFGSQGTVWITKYNVASPSSLTFNMSSGVTALTPIVASGHNAGNTTSAAISAPFALFQLSWSAQTHTLTLFVDGVQKATYTDTTSPYTTFSRIFLSGNTSGLFDSLSVTTPGGASVPFTTYEAEAATLGGGATVTALTSANLVATGTADVPMIEASGRAYATLAAQGQSLTFQVTNAANSIVIRHNVPYTAAYNTRTGAGATLHLWVNNETTPRQVTQIVYTTSGTNGGAASQVLSALSLSSYHNEAAKAYWEETRARISGATLNPGDTLRLEVDAGDTGTPYNIDSIDLENVPAALVQPANTYSVLSYGAVGNGIADDTAAIQSCINAAQTAGKGVWIPTGIYCQSAVLSVNAVKIYGAGMWYTNLINTYDPNLSSWGGYMGFTLSGSGAEVHDLALDSAALTTRSSGQPAFDNAAGATNWKIQNIWVTHSNVGCWMDNTSNGLITGCRVRFTYADGIHLDGNTSLVTISNCHVRGTGDDALAILAGYGTNFAGPSHDNTAIYNTAQANWGASNFDLAGGYNNVISYNYFADSDVCGALAINIPGAYHMYNTTGATITGNTIVRGGGDLGGQRRGAIWIYPDWGYPNTSPAITNVTFDGNYILNSLWRGIHLYNGDTQGSSLTFSNNTVDGVMNPTGDGIDVDSIFVGTGTFLNNNVTAPGAAYHNYAPSTFTGSGSGNVPAFSFP